REILHVDPVRRELLVTAAGISADEDPYIGKPCVVSFEGGPVTVLSGEPGDHRVWLSGTWALSLLDLTDEDRWDISGVSPNGAYFVETVGRADALPHTVVRRPSGGVSAGREAPRDDARPAGWQWPEPVELLAADGVTDTYGLLFKPRGYDSSESYPLIDLVYGGPQLSHVPKSAFAHGGAGTDLQYL